MSAFLGPIHFWMYDKIQAQEELIRRMAQKAVAEGWASEEAARSYVNTEDRPLDEIIDGDDIHGWLTAHIDDAENRYAQLVTNLLNGHEERLDALKELVYAYGAEHALAAESEPAELYRGIESYTLNGMPCDGVNIVTDKSAAHFSWEQRFDVHSPYWTQAGGKPQIYYDLRNQLIAGLLSNASYAVATTDNETFSLMPMA